jgi:hypothetical protein
VSQARRAVARRHFLSGLLAVPVVRLVPVPSAPPAATPLEAAVQNLRAARLAQFRGAPLGSGTMNILQAVARLRDVGRNEGLSPPQHRAVVKIAMKLARLDYLGEMRAA